MTANNYDDIINLPHFEPKFHKRMPMELRAAQFSPFEALMPRQDDEFSNDIENG